MAKTRTTKQNLGQSPNPYKVEWKDRLKEDRRTQNRKQSLMPWSGQGTKFNTRVLLDKEEDKFSRLHNQQ